MLSPKIRSRLIGLCLNPVCMCLYDMIGLLRTDSNLKPGATSIQYNQNKSSKLEKTSKLNESEEEHSSRVL